MEPRYDQPRFQAVVDQFGEPESRRLLSTPALVCDHDLLVENVARMATRTALAGTALRPHVKSHKSAYVARLQLEAGASTWRSRSSPRRKPSRRVFALTVTSRESRH